MVRNRLLPALKRLDIRWVVVVGACAAAVASGAMATGALSGGGPTTDKTTHGAAPRVFSLPPFDARPRLAFAKDVDAKLGDLIPAGADVGLYVEDLT